MSRNVNREPSPTDVIRKTLKYIAGTAALFAGAFALSKLAVFRGRDFMTPGLTDDQILVMDKHNGHHRTADVVENFGRGVAALSSKPTEAQLKAIKEVNDVLVKSLNDGVKDLPEPLAHTH